MNSVHDREIRIDLNSIVQHCWHDWWKFNADEIENWNKNHFDLFQTRTGILGRRELNLVNAPLEEGWIIADNFTTSSIMNEIRSFFTIQYWQRCVQIDLYIKLTVENWSNWFKWNNPYCALNWFPVYHENHSFCTSDSMNQSLVAVF